jgi:hypothetical protein
MTPAARYRAACARLGLPVWRRGAVDTDGNVCPGAWADERKGEPDFTDPATVGVLLAAVREAWDCHAIHTQGRLHQLGEGWWSDKSQRQPTWRWTAVVPFDATYTRPTEAAALIAALEAAPARRPARQRCEGGQP